VPVRRRLPAGVDMAAAYAACDAVVLPSSWEGFGLPLIESALHRKPIAVGHFPVASELAAFGLRWFPVDDHVLLKDWLADPDPAVLDHNEHIANTHFGIDALALRLELVLSGPRMCHHAVTVSNAAGGAPECDCLTA
jgi:glycosyltransferase involved in cell wall biosynthesis